MRKKAPALDRLWVLLSPNCPWNKEKQGSHKRVVCRDKDEDGSMWRIRPRREAALMS